MSDGQVITKKGAPLQLGYRSKRADEKTGQPSDAYLVALDPNTQRDFERVIFSIINQEETRIKEKK